METTIMGYIGYRILDLIIIYPKPYSIYLKETTGTGAELACLDPDNT